MQLLNTEVVEASEQLLLLAHLALIVIHLALAVGLAGHVVLRHVVHLAVALARHVVLGHVALGLALGEVDGGGHDRGVHLRPVGH